MNINHENLILVAVGGLSAIGSVITKKEPFGTLGLLAGIGIGTLGLLDMTGVFTLDKLKSMIPGAKSNYAVGAYAVDLRNLPYDANNYYLPPRDTSILP